MAYVSKRPNASWKLLALLCAFACHKPAPAQPEIVFSSPDLPKPADLLMGCQTQETKGYLSLLILLPPWDREYPKAMSELGFVLEERREPSCLQAAKALFIELALAYPRREEALRATLEVGALLLYLKEPIEELERLFVPFPDRGARLLEVAQNSPPEKAVVFLKTFGGAQAESLLSSYGAWLRDNPDRPQIPQ